MRYYQHMFHLNLTLPSFYKLEINHALCPEGEAVMAVISNPITLELEAKDQELKFNHTNIASLRLDRERPFLNKYIHIVSKGYNTGFSSTTGGIPLFRALPTESKMSDNEVPSQVC